MIYLIFFIGLILGAIGGFFIARSSMKKYLSENPPIDEQMMKQMASGMGRNLSQKQLNQMMNQMKKAPTKK